MPQNGRGRWSLGYISTGKPFFFIASERERASQSVANEVEGGSGKAMRRKGIAKANPLEVEEKNLLRDNVLQLVKHLLPRLYSEIGQDDEISVEEDALTALTESARVFIELVSSR